MEYLYNRIVALCDYGLDDAIATIELIANQNKFEKIDIVAVGGNFPSDIALRNARVLLSNLPCDSSKITIVDTTDIPQPGAMLTFVHGDDGMGDILSQQEEKIEIIKFDKWLSSVGKIDCLLSLGPMTITDIILQHNEVDKFVFMAGCVNGITNYHGYEFNHGMDKDAFNKCVCHEHSAVTLDIACEALSVDDKDIDGNTLYGKMVLRLRELIKNNCEKHCYVWDEIAVNYILHPEKYTEKVLIDKDKNRISCLFLK